MDSSKRQQLLIVAVIVAIAVFAGDKLLLTPLTTAWKNRNTRIAELEKQLEQGRTLLKGETAIRDRWEKLRRNTLPASTSTAEQTFYNAIDRWAQDSRISINALTPQWKRDSDEFTTLQCRIDTSGNIGSLSRFVYNIEKDPMALRLESLELGARDKNGQQLSMVLQVSGLVLSATKQ